MITSAGVELEDVGGSLSMGAFSSFLKNQSFDSALWRSTHPDLAEWTSTLKTNLILADIYDLLAQINSNMVGGFSHKKPSKAKPYPRSWLKKTKEKKFGKGALPKDKLREWIKNYRRKES